jgi:hypothetical protein
MYISSAKPNTDYGMPSLFRYSYLNDFSSPIAPKQYRAGSLGEEGIVLADSNVVSGVKAGAPLAHDDLACLYQLTSAALYS